MDVVGLLLAAGAGRRMGMSKALVTDDDGTPWVLRSVEVLRDGGCARVVVVVGAQAPAIRRLLAAQDVDVVEAEHWAEGMGASLRAGLTHLVAGEDPAHAALVHLVDLPDVGADVVARVVAGVAPDALARAAYSSGVPGHPVLLGRDHWAAVAASATGDSGARAYLASHPVRLVDCADLAGGTDVDVAR